MQCVSTELVAENQCDGEVGQVFAVSAVLTACAGWGNSCSLSPHRLLCLFTWCLGLFSLLDLFQHPEVLLVAGEA